MNRKNFLRNTLIGGMGGVLFPSLSKAKRLPNITVPNEGLVSHFPKFSKPIPITKANKEHFYASYFGINAFSANEKFALVLETDIKNKLPQGDQPATLGLVEIATKEFIPLTKTYAWNFQQGCMGFWLGTAPDDQIIFNDLRKGKFVSVIMDVHTKKELNVIPYPVADVSEDGKTAVGLNFSRIWITRTSYGYGGGGQDARPDVQFPEDDGITLIDLETGKTKLIVSIASLRDQVPIVPFSGIEYINHVKISPKASKIFWLARATPKWETVSFTSNIDGTDIQTSFPEGWGGSHFDWLNEEQMVVTANYKNRQYSHVFFTAGKKTYKRLGGGLLDFDGHCTFSPDGRWMATDGYHTSLGKRKLFILDRETQAVFPVGEYDDPDEYNVKSPYSNDTAVRCDLHNRWSKSGKLLGFNSVMSGSRQAYILERLD